MIPLFKSAYTFKSILTLDPSDKVKLGGPSSIVKISEDNNLEKVFLVEDNMVSFLEAKKHLKDKLIFGLRLTFCDDISKDDTINDCKFVIFANNSDGYYKLIEIFTFAGVEGNLKGNPRIDYKNFKRFWDEKSLTLAVPFYDSFIHKNATTFSSCSPDIKDYNPIFFEEDNNLFIDSVIKECLDNYLEYEKFERIKAKSIYYEKKEDFTAWMTYKCIQNRTTLENPNLNNCASNEFCWESYLECKNC